MAKVKKSAGDFNTYTLEVSYGELLKIQELSAANPDVISDELGRAINWYLDNEVPAPGQDKDEFKAARDAEKNAAMPDEEETNPAAGPSGEEVPPNLDDVLPEPPPEPGAEGQ